MAIADENCDSQLFGCPPNSMLMYTHNYIYRYYYYTILQRFINYLFICPKLYKLNDFVKKSCFKFLQRFLCLWVKVIGNFCVASRYYDDICLDGLRQFWSSHASLLQNSLAWKDLGWKSNLVPGKLAYSLLRSHY